MIVRLGLVLLFAFGSSAAAKEQSPVGEYRLVGEQDVASGLRLRADGRFQYFLSAGALDEQAEGRWTSERGLVTLVTEPKPVSPRFEQASPGRTDSAALAVKVSSPEGRGIAGVDLRIGFDRGEPVDAYTQEDGWSLPPEERRAPQWIELGVPMHRLAPTRFPIDPAAGNALAFTLVPNDLGVLDFTGVTIRVAKNALLVERDGGRLHYVRGGK